MKKKFKLFAFIALMTTYYSNAQMGINTKFPDASAALEIKSPDNTKGVLMPRSTTTQINAIPLPAEGLIVYDTTQHCFLQNAGTAAIPKWVPLINAADNGLTVTGSKVQLGGTLTKPTALTTTAANTLAIQGLTNSTDNTDSPIVLTADGTLKKSSFPVANVVPTDVGSVIAIDGKLVVAQEITVLMDADFNFSVTPTPIAIGNFKNIVIDNKNKYIGTSTSNSFSVEASGTYQLTLNVMLSQDTATVSWPVIGIWDNTLSQWIARVNDEYTAMTVQTPMNRRLQTYTLITAIQLTVGKTYSFRVSNNVAGAVLAFSSGGSGTGPVSYASLKRLK